MDIVQLKQAIQQLPEEAQTKPLLAALTEHLESFSSSLVTLRQERAEGEKPAQEPRHPYGLCTEDSCTSCLASKAQFAQAGIFAMRDELVSEGRKAALLDVEQALRYGKAEELADKVKVYVSAWIAADRPAQPTYIVTR